MKKTPCAYPIITCDPFFSVWFEGKNPTECDTVHWSGRTMPIRITAVLDGTEYSLFGNNNGLPMMNYLGSEVTPLRTVFEYKMGETKLTLGFFTPQFLDDLYTVTLPISYIYYECSSPVTVKVAVSTAIAADERSQKVVACTKQGYAFAETEGAVPLSRSGDCVCAGWGRGYLMHESASVDCGKYGVDNLPYMTALSDKQCGHFTLGYDDIESMRFMGKVLPAYWRTKEQDFVKLMTAEDKKFDAYLAKAAKFDADLLSEAGRVSSDYADIVSLAYRQSIAAHKLVVGEDGLYFISKENSSNGCGATLDVTYPSIPLYLKYNPELVRAMLRPLFRFALSPLWHYDFAPHDCGQYPLLDAQAYGKNPDGTYDFNMQMPVEECGNAIICLAAACFADGQFDLAMQSQKLIRQYADYLIKNGYNPDNQLCTDDFAGHLPHNCNLSIKAIVALAAAGKLYGDDGYICIAKDMANRFVSEAKSAKGGTRLTFDDDGGWSLKYNMIWDKLFNLGLFDEAVYNAEATRYEAESHTYGTPLDCRKDYTKTDWLVWCAAMCGGEYETKTYERIVGMITNTKDCYPFSDWYDTVNADNSGFKARSVIGGVFIRLI